jgi:acetoin utilization deacetylase AcuC-like enzyme
MKLSLKGYDHLSRQLTTMADSICQGRIVFVMEGGYNVTTLSNGLLNVAFALLGDSQLADPRGPAKGPETDIRPIIERVIQTHKLA